MNRPLYGISDKLFLELRTCKDITKEEFEKEKGKGSRNTTLFTHPSFEDYEKSY